MSYSSARKLRRPPRSLDPANWCQIWQDRHLAGWPSEPISGVLKIAGVELAIDRADILPDGHLWIEGWATAPAATVFRLEADGYDVLWQSAFRTQRRDVIEALRLSLSGAEANLGFQLLAKIGSRSPAAGRLALAVETPAGPAIIVPVITRAERSASFWHSFYEAVRYRGPRTVEYLEMSVKVLREIRKADWRERARGVRQSIEQQMPAREALKVLLVSRHQPHAAYINLIQLTSVLDQSADFIVCSIGQPAAHRANEFSPHLAELHGHTVGFVAAETGTPSSELIEQFLASCERRQAPALIVYDDVAVAGAAQSVREAVSKMAVNGAGAHLWPRQSHGSAPGELPFVRPPTSPDDLGPYWSMTRQMTHAALGAVLVQPGRASAEIPPFEGRGLALEYLARRAFAGAAVAGAPMLDLLESAGQGEALTLDVLMLVSE